MQRRPQQAHEGFCTVTKVYPSCVQNGPNLEPAVAIDTGCGAGQIRTTELYSTGAGCLVVGQLSQSCS